jgi:hypothetical protein
MFYNDKRNEVHTADPYVAEKALGIEKGILDKRHRVSRS